MQQFLNSTLWSILSSGAFVNFLIIIAGGFVGIFLKKGFPEKLRKGLMVGVALCVTYIGISGMFDKGANTLVIVVSFAFGALIGELIDLDKWINRLGEKLQSRFGADNSAFANGFVNATILFCVGAMSIVGSIKSGVSGDNSILYSKSVIDGITSTALASTLGAGVMLSSLPVLLLEGTVTALAVAVAPLLTEEIICQISVIGSVLIMAIGFNMLGITKIKVMNYIPAVLLPIIILLIF